ncbi:MAG: hypothetical protein ACLFUJ_10425 [Phycisphaerae bacterium]
MNPILENLPLVTIFGFFTFSAVGWFVQDDPMRMSLFGLVGAAMTYGLGRLVGRISDEIMPPPVEKPAADDSASASAERQSAQQQDQPGHPGQTGGLGLGAVNTGQAAWREGDPAEDADTLGPEQDLTHLPGADRSPGHEAGPATATAEPKKATVREHASNDAPFPMGREPSGE